MNIAEIKCPKCNAIFKIKFGFRPKEVACPKCTHRHALPTNAIVQVVDETTPTIPTLPPRPKMPIYLVLWLSLLMIANAFISIYFFSHQEYITYGGSPQLGHSGFDILTGFVALFAAISAAGVLKWKTPGVVFTYVCNGLLCILLFLNSGNIFVLPIGVLIIAVFVVMLYVGKNKPIQWME